MRFSSFTASCHSFVKPPFFSQLPGCFPYRSFTLDFIKMQACSMVWDGGVSIRVFRLPGSATCGVSQTCHGDVR